MSFSVNMSGALAKLTALKDAAQSGLEDAAKSVLNDAQQVIEQDGDGNWAPFKHPPKRAHSLLWESGALLDSISPDHGILSISANEVIVGSTLPYAAVMQFGNPSRDIPPRPFFMLNDDGVKQRAAAAMKARMLQELHEHA